MFEEALVHLEESDTFAAIEFLDQQPNPLEVAEIYNKLVGHLYWKAKNVTDMIAIARAGIQYSLDQAADQEDTEEQAEGSDVIEDADDQPFLGIVRERFAVGRGGRRVTDHAVLRQSLHRHEEGADHPVGHDQRDRW